jgi:hypothetical protein
MCFYFTTELLRSLNYGMTSCFQAFDLDLPLSSGVSLRLIYEDLVIDSRHPRSPTNMDDRFLLLILIIAEISNLYNSVGPLVPSELSSGLTFTALSRRERQTTPITRNTRYRNPFAGTSVITHYLHTVERLTRALTVWKAAFLPDVSAASALPFEGPGLLTLYLFAKLLLFAGPNLLPLPAFVGYTPEKNFRAQSSLPPSRLPASSAETLDSAWQILEAIEESKPDAFTAAGSCGVTPMWYPIVAFYASLTVWASSLSKNSAIASLKNQRRMLKLFEVELRQMHWQSARVMADILRDLRQV